MKRVKFLADGKYANANPAAPQFPVMAGDILELDDATAESIKDSDNVEFIGEVSEDVKEKSEEAAEEKSEEEAEEEEQEEVTTDGGLIETEGRTSETLKFG